MIKKEPKIKEENGAVETAPISDKKSAFQDLVKAYEINNPVKYALKKEALLAKLNNL